MNTFTKFAVLVVAVVGLLVWVAMAGLKGDMTYYKTISDLNKMGDQAKGKRLRVGGEVEKDSVVRNGREVSFILTQDALKLKVVYNGAELIPDTFKDGAQALADGRLGPNGVFEANKIEAKCASKYEAKPVQQKNAREHDRAQM
jgi:cytochrome c-type biogenesis protein CcmE